MRNPIALLAGLLLLCSLPIVQADEPTAPPPRPKLPDLGVSILRTGQFHGDEVSAKSGEQWLGLYVNEYGYVLKPVTLQVDLTYDSVVDADPKAPTGKLVSVKGASLGGAQQQPVVLVKGITAPRMARLKTVYDSGEFIPPGDSVELDLGERFYRLTAYGDVQEDDVIHNYRLKLTEGKTAQLVHTESALPVLGSGREDLALPTLLWAGDLDGDNQVDLLMELSNQYSVSVYTLFLSSMVDERDAKSGPFLQKTAEFVFSPSS